MDIVLLSSKCRLDELVECEGLLAGVFALGRTIQDVKLDSHAVELRGKERGQASQFFLEDILFRIVVEAN